MPVPTHPPTDPVEAVTALVLATFRLNGVLVASGDDLVGDLGLSSARWRVLGAVAFAGEPMTVARIGRAMGLSRQSAQRVVNDLWDIGYVGLHPNPEHRRAPLVRLTAAGEQAFASAMARQRPWARSLAEGLDTGFIADAAGLLTELAARLGRGPPAESNPA